MTTLTSRQFNQDTGSAKKAAEESPVVITDRGRPTHVLLTFTDYERMKQPRRSIADALYLPGAENIELDIPARDSYPERTEVEFD